MANTIMPFNFGDNLLRVSISDNDGNPWFVAKDACDILGIQNPSDTVRKCLDSDEIADIDIIYTSCHTPPAEPGA